MSVFHDEPPEEVWCVCLEQSPGAMFIQGVAGNKEDAERLVPQLDAEVSYGPWDSKRVYQVLRDSENGSLVFNTGFLFVTPYSLKARENWFARFLHRLPLELGAPTSGYAMFPSEAPVTKPLGSYRNLREGGGPKHRRQVECSHCGEEPLFVGMLDFRKVNTLTCPRACLGLYYCPCNIVDGAGVWFDYSDDLSFDGVDGLVGLEGWLFSDYDWEPVVEFCGDFAFRETELGELILEDENLCTDICTLYCDKMGGRPYLYELPRVEDSRGNEMTFLGQLAYHPLICQGSGTVLAFYSWETQETKVIVEART